VFVRVRTGYKQRLRGEGRDRRKARVGSINLKILKVIFLTFKNESASRVFIFLHEGVMWMDWGSGGWIEGDVCCSTSGYTERNPKIREVVCMVFPRQQGFFQFRG